MSLTPILGISQNSNWTKESRNMVYNEIINELTPYRNLTQDQKESISLCCLEEITKKYPMVEYQTKIEIEIKRIKNSSISQCSKNIGVELQVEQEKTNSAVQDDWTKESKNNLYSEALTFLSKYDNINQQQKESVALCISSDITSNYSKKQISEFLDVEVKKIKNDALKKCLDKFDLTLKKNENNKLNKKSLCGCWQSYDYSICFFETGEFEMRSDKGFIKKRTKGKWFLEPEKIVFSSKDMKETYKILFFNGESLKIEEESSKKEVHFTKMLNLQNN